MTLNWDPVALLNVVFCIIILIMGIWFYKKTAKISLYIGVGFLFFAIAHLGNSRLKRWLTRARVDNS